MNRMAKITKIWKLTLLEKLLVGTNFLEVNLAMFFKIQIAFTLSLSNPTFGIYSTDLVTITHVAQVYSCSSLHIAINKPLNSMTLFNWRKKWALWPDMKTCQDTWSKSRKQDAESYVKLCNFLYNIGEKQE